MEKSIEALVTGVMSELRKVGYSEFTLDVYRVLYRHLIRFMDDNGYKEYTPEVAQAALPIISKIRSGEKNSRMFNVVLKHLDRYIANGQFEVPKKKRKREPIFVYPEFDEYLEWCAVKGLSQSTIKKRHYITKRISEGFVALGLKSVKSIDLRIIIDYCKTLESLSLNQKHDFTLVLKELIRFLHNNGYVPKDFADNILSVPYNGNSKIPSYYTTDEVTKILQAMDKKKPLHKRNYAIALIAARTGIRRSDIASLTFSSIDWEQDKIEIIQQKTGVPLYLPLLPEVGEAIVDYILNARPISDSDCIFVKHFPPHDPINPATINDIVFRATEKSGIDINKRKRGPHALRFSLASHLLNRGETIKTVADALGHQNIQTTTIYTKIDTPNLEKCALSVPQYRELGDFYVDERLEAIVVGDLAVHIVDYILYKRAMGQKAVNELKHLRNLAKFSLGYDLSAQLISQEMANNWLLQRKTEGAKSYVERRGILAAFATYLYNLGHEVFVPETAKNRVRSKFSPHIYSPDELTRFFTVTDSLDPSQTSVILNNRSLPAVLFRVLLGCGLRVSEALNLRRNDLNFQEKTIRILESKNHKDRLVVMDDSLSKHLLDYIGKTAPTPEQFIFRKDNGEEVTPALVYNWFRDFIDKAGIEHKGKGYGPRVHDFRHTFAVLSLNKLLEEGKPLYTVLPILKDFLGHHDIQSTEGYVRFAQWMIPNVIKSMNEISEKIIPNLEDTNEAQVV